MTKDIHRSPFSPSTRCKLDLYEMYLRESLPLFITREDIDQITICDYFAGPGSDCDGTKGSPLIALDVVTELMKDERFSSKQKTFRFIFNDASKNKAQKLKEHLAQVEGHHNITIEVYNESFSDCFNHSLDKLKMVRTANILFIDQYGIKEVTKDIFQQITSLFNTDFIFFLASGSANRFKEFECIWDNLPAFTDDEKKLINGKNVHRIISEKYYQWLPAHRDFYLGSFSILKQANVYGLVFGSGHPFGLEKFLDIAWKRSAEFGGEANFDIDDDGLDQRQLFLFPDDNVPTKIKEFNKILANKISHKNLLSNHEVYIFTLLMGMLPRHARDVISELIKTGLLPKQSLSISRDAYKKPPKMIVFPQESSHERHLPTEGAGS